MEKIKTHFEQVPVEYAEQVAEQEMAREAQGRAAKREWRQIAAAVTTETDPIRMMALVDELNEALEELRRAKPGASTDAGLPPVNELARPAGGDLA